MFSGLSVVLLLFYCKEFPIHHTLIIQYLNQTYGKVRKGHGIHGTKKPSNGSTDERVSRERLRSRVRKEEVQYDTPFAPRVRERM